VAAPFSFDRSWWFPVPPAQLWATLVRTDEYPSWWTWLRELDTDGLAPGNTARCVIQSPLPYTLRCTITVEELRAPETIMTTVTGDLCGPAGLHVEDAKDGSTARLCWTLDLGNPLLSRLALVGRPAMSWAHDRIVATGVEQFRRRALGAATRTTFGEGGA